MRFFRVVPAVILAALLAGSFGGKASSQPAVKPIAVTLEEFKIKPKAIEVRAGKVELAVSNKGTVEHNFIIFYEKEKRVEEGREIKPNGKAGKDYPEAYSILPGETKQFTFILKPGKYMIYCLVPGHKEAGMQAILVVK